MVSVLPMTAPVERDLQRLLAEERFVRELAQQLVAGDADEVVQQTWLHAVQQGGRGVAEPRHWLARILRNVVANLRRGDRRRRAREQSFAAQELVPSSLELAEREEQRRALVAAVDALPATLRTVVLLRWFDGRPPREIAKALGVPVATVSTQLQRALAHLRERLDADHGGDRRAWAVPLVPFALRPELPLALPAFPVVGAPAVPTLLLGAIVMTTKTKLAATAGAIALAAGAWLLLTQPTPPLPQPPIASESPPAVAERGGLGADATAGTTTVASEREVAPLPPGSAGPSIGVVIAHLRRHDGTPAAGALLTLCQRGADARFDGTRQRTDATGTVRYDAVTPGRYVVSSDTLQGTRQRIEVAAGQTLEIEITIQRGVDVRGIVVDAAKKPVAGALVEMAPMALTDAFPEVVAITGADGRFAVVDCAEMCLVGARALGHLASNVRFLHGKKGNVAEIELVLGRDGGAVAGVVVDAMGKPIGGAVVIVGNGKVSGILGQEHIPPFGALARSDEHGRLLVVGVPAGKQPIRVRARGAAPWNGEVDVVAETTITHRIELEPGAILRGHVRDAAGKPASDAEVEIGTWDDLAHYRSLTSADGTFELTGLPLGEFAVRVEHDDHGKASTTVQLSVPDAASCTLQLSRGHELRGRVVDPDGQPISGATVQCMEERAAPDRWFAFARTDAQGHFAAANCPESGTISCTVGPDGYEALEVRGVERTAEVVLRPQRALRRSARIVGRVVDPAGRAMANANAYAFREEPHGRSGFELTDNDGRFELGPLPPGSWRIEVRATGHPTFRSEAHALAADATLDLGMITFALGSTARVRLVGEPIPGVQLVISDAADTRWWAVNDRGEGLRSDPLAAGDYLLRVKGPTIAATVVPFTIRAGEDVVVDAPITSAATQTFRCDVPAGAAIDSVSLRVFRGETYLGRAWVNPKDPASNGGLGLAPGEYRVVAEAGALRGAATFTVGATAGAPVTIVLR